MEYKLLTEVGGIYKLLKEMGQIYSVQVEYGDKGRHYHNFCKMCPGKIVWECTDHKGKLVRRLISHSEIAALLALRGVEVKEFYVSI